MSTELPLPPSRQARRREFRKLSRTATLGGSYLFANSTSGRQPLLNKLSELTEAANEIKEVCGGSLLANRHKIRTLSQQIS